jgi:hypothetical protein
MSILAFIVWCKGKKVDHLLLSVLKVLFSAARAADRLIVCADARDARTRGVRSCIVI